MLRKQVVQKHVDYQEITHIIGHGRNVYVTPLMRIILFLGCLYILFLLVHRYFPHNTNVKWIFGGLGLFFYGKGMIDFLNLYLDCLVLTPSGIVVFKREGLLEYQTDTFSWDRIETVSHTQDSLRDKLMYKGDIVLTLEHGVSYGFHDVALPLKYSNIILKQKQMYLTDSYDDSDNDKFELLVETLGEVIQDYMGNKKPIHDVDEEDYEDEYYSM